MTKDYARKHSLDLPHVTAVELPLKVKDTDRAISMLGGKNRLQKVINSHYRPLPAQSSSHSVDDRNLELRLRNDPFHHPIQASTNRREKVLLKISIPKHSLPHDYYDDPSKYTVKELMKRSYPQGHAKVSPVAIVNNNYNFRAIADFQMTTKNNPHVQAFKENVLNVRTFEDVKKYYEEDLVTNNEFMNPDVYENKDHQMVPPPHFSGIRFPFDFKYQKSAYTVTLRDENGERKVIMKSDNKKLFTNTVDFKMDNVPTEPLPEIVKRYKQLSSTDLTQEYADRKLKDCIEFLRLLFEIKPVWIRRTIVDVTPELLRSAVKEALPYVSFCYKNGPWRFCNIRLGVNPKEVREFWIFQSEYFRLQEHQHKPHQKGRVDRVRPRTIEAVSPEADIKISESLVFTGTKLPEVFNYHVGDIVDADVLRVIESAMNSGEEYFFRETLDFQDGWIRKQVMETVRRIVRYKLNRLSREQHIDEEKVQQIINTNYEDKDDDSKIDDDDEIDGDKDLDAELQDDENDELEDDAEDDQEVPHGPLGSEEEIFKRLRAVNPEIAERLRQFTGLIKQDAMENSN